MKRIKQKRYKRTPKPLNPVRGVQINFSVAPGNFTVANYLCLLPLKHLWSLIFQRNKIMLKHIFNCSLLTFSLLTFSLSAQDFAEVDEKARQVAFPKNQNVAQLAADLTEGLSTEKEKARAIYVWLTEHISYDVRTAFDEDAEAEEVVAKQKSRVVLKSKKAVCEGYANLFCDLCAAAGVKAFRAVGPVKNLYGRIPRSGHAWNLVRADGQWGLVDATWGAGNVDDEARKFARQFNPDFFFAAPEVMIKNHLPTDPLFQLSTQPINLQQFKMKDEERAALSPAQPDPSFAHFADTLNALAELDSNAQVLNSILRTLRFDPTNNRARYYLAAHLSNQSVRIFNAYATEQNQRVLNKIRPTKAILQGYDAQIVEAEQYARQALAEADRIATGDRYWSASGNIKRNAKDMLRSCADAKKRNDETLKRL